MVRSRLKRLVREAFRLEQASMPAGLDLVVTVRTPTGAELGAFRAALREAALELSVEWERRVRRASARAAKEAGREG